MDDENQQITYKTAVIANLLMLSTKRVQELSNLGHVPKIANNKYMLAEAVQGYIKYLKDMIPGNRAQPSNTAINDFKARKAKSDAENSEIDLAQKKGELLVAKEVEVELSNLMILFKTNCRNIPDRVCIQLAGELPEDYIKKTVMREIDLVLEELSKGIKKI